MVATNKTIGRDDKVRAINVPSEVAGLKEILLSIIRTLTKESYQINKLLAKSEFEGCEYYVLGTRTDTGMAFWSFIQITDDDGNDKLALPRKGEIMSSNLFFEQDEASVACLLLSDLEPGQHHVYSLKDAVRLRIAEINNIVSEIEALYENTPEDRERVLGRMR